MMALDFPCFSVDNYPFASTLLNSVGHDYLFFLNSHALPRFLTVSLGFVLLGGRTGLPLPPLRLGVPTLGIVILIPFYL